MLIAGHSFTKRDAAPMSRTNRPANGMVGTLNLNIVRIHFLSTHRGGGRVTGAALDLLQPDRENGGNREHDQHQDTLHEQ